MKLGEPLVGVRLQWKGRLELAVLFRRQAHQCPQHRSDEAREGEDRRGRESGQDRSRRTVQHGKAEWLARLERDAVHKDSGVPKTLEYTVILIALALGSTSGEQQQIHLCKCLAHRFLNGLFVIMDHAQRHRLTAQFLHGVGQHRAVAVVHLARGHRTSGCDQLISGGENPDSRLTPHPNLHLAKSREGSGLPVSQQIATPQHHLSCPNVRTCVGDATARCNRLEDLNAPRNQVRVFDQHHPVGPAWQNASRGNGRGGAESDRALRNHPAVQRFRIEREVDGMGVLGPKSVLGPNRKAIEIRAVEAGHVVTGEYIPRQHPPQRLSQRHHFLP